MKTLEKILKLIDERIKAKEEFKDMKKRRNKIIYKIQDNPKSLGIEKSILLSYINKPIYVKDKLYLIPNLTMLDDNYTEHFIYVKLGYSYEEQVRGYRQFNKLKSYIKKNRLDAIGYLITPEEKYNSINDFFKKSYIYKTK